MIQLTDELLQDETFFAPNLEAEVEAARSEVSAREEQALNLATKRWILFCAGMCTNARAVIGMCLIATTLLSGMRFVYSMGGDDQSWMIAEKFNQHGNALFRAGDWENAIDGQTLRDRLRQGLPQLTEALRYAIQIADALAHMHSREKWHRDLKPENILLDHDRR